MSTELLAVAAYGVLMALLLLAARDYASGQGRS